MLYPAAGFVPDRPDLGHAAEGWNLADPAFYADGARPSTCLLPAAAYRTLAFADLEDDAVWTRSWLCIGYQDEIRAPGDLLPFTAGHHGIHVQREAGGGLVGRFNKAQHGGCRAVPAQCLTGTKTRCSFTACGYSRDGEPLGADADGAPTPAMHQFLGLRPERLLPVAVRSAGPLILANLDASQATSDPAPDTPAARLPLRERPTIWRSESAANWKLLLAALARFDTAGPTPGPGMLAAEGRRADGAPIQVHASFPNLVLLTDGGSGCAVILQPTSLGQTLCRIAAFGTGADAAAWRAEIEVRTAPAVALHDALTRAHEPDRPAADEAALWLQAELAARVLSRSEAGDTAPLYAARAGR